MILRSKLSGSKYKTANPDIYLYGDTRNLDPVFAGRLAYVFKVLSDKYGKITRGKIGDGYRSYSDQVDVYDEFIEWKKTGIGNIHSAAVPGTSWHGVSLAVDVSSSPIRWMSNAELAPYGLCKPIASEGWHIQPIETAKMGTRCNDTYKPVDLSPLLKAKFGLSDDTIAFMERYQFALSLAEQLLKGTKKFSAQTIAYLKSYRYWTALKDKLGLVA